MGKVQVNWLIFSSVDLSNVVLKLFILFLGIGHMLYFDQCSDSFIIFLLLLSHFKAISQWYYPRELGIGC